MDVAGSSERDAPSEVRIRRARFEDLATILRLIERSIAEGCRVDYDAAQRRVVFLAYAQHLFSEAVAGFDTLVAERPRDGRIVATTQLDPDSGRLRALFVDGDLQGRGFGHLLIEAIIMRARAHGLTQMHGAMSLGAVPFYTRHGFRPYDGPDRLVHGGIVVPISPMRRSL